MQKGKKIFIRVLLSLAGAAAVALIAVFCFYMVWEEAPEVEPQAPSTKPLSTENSEEEPEPEATPFSNGRRDGVYTVLLVGNDDGTGNTDTIMVGKIDTVEHKMDFVSIPRDTLINVDWNVRKINSVYWGSRNSGGSGIDALSMHIKSLLGFDIDCYAVIDLGAFIDVVDAMGGVDFDVPVPMHYQDEGQNLYINLEPGMQHLDGYQAMGLCRFRYGYANGDFGRMEMQQRFLKSCAEQFIKLGNIPNVSKVVKILSESLDTNLSSGNIAFFLRQALQCSPENINFHTAPSQGRGIGGLSYAVLEIDKWLDMVNSVLNPYESPVGYGNVNIVFWNGSSYEATTELKGEWYYTWEPESQKETGEPEEPESTPEPEESPGPGEEPEQGGETEPEGPEGGGTSPEPEPEPGPEAPPEGGEESGEGVFA